MPESNSLSAYNCKSQLYAICIYYITNRDACQEGIAGCWQVGGERALAELCGLSVTTVSLVEQGKTLGHELIFCLEGAIEYEIRGNSYLLDAGDSVSTILLILQTQEGWEESVEQHPQTGTSKRKSM
jgi:transcriptional regulator with XRE-family HTH domain